MKYLIIAYCLLFSCISFGQDSKKGCLEILQIESNIYQEDREVWVGLPNDYDPEKKYSIVYVLDAETRFDIVYAFSKELYLYHSKVPELIVVGIPHIDWPHRKMDLTFTDTKLDSRGLVHEQTTLEFVEDLTGGGMDFLKHLEEEVLVTINENYSSNGFNTLVGHSLGGYYCAYLLPMETSFSAFQIYDPSVWYNSGDALNHLKENLSKDAKKKRLHHFGISL